jgi:hypothetical protein
MPGRAMVRHFANLTTPCRTISVLTASVSSSSIYAFHFFHVRSEARVSSSWSVIGDILRKVGAFFNPWPCMYPIDEP